MILISRNLNQQSHSFSLPCFDYISCNMVLPISSLTINIIWSICPTNTIFRTSKIAPNVVFTNIWIFCFLSVRSWPLTNTERALSSVEAFFIHFSGFVCIWWGDLRRIISLKMITERVVRMLFFCKIIARLIIASTPLIYFIRVFFNLIFWNRKIGLSRMCLVEIHYLISIGKRVLPVILFKKRVPLSVFRSTPLRRVSYIQPSRIMGTRTW